MAGRDPYTPLQDLDLDADALLRLAFTDDLTGLHNRRYLFKKLAPTLDAGLREGAPAAVALLDLDGFKPINDARGHLVGDRVLRAVGRRLLAAVGRPEPVVRYGGDEFIICFHGEEAPGVKVFLEGFLEALAAEGVETEDGERFALTASGGVALGPADGATVADLIQAADAAMYRAKAQGARVLRAGEGEGPRAQDAPPEPRFPCANLHGREDALSRIDALLAQARAGAARFAGLAGAPGMGATRILRGAAAMERARGACVLADECFEAQARDPYVSLARAVDRYLEEHPERARAALASLTPAEKTLLREGDRIPALFRLAEPPADLGAMTEPERRITLFGAFDKLLRALARGDGLVLAVDQFQWIDEGSARVLYHLLAFSRGLKFALLAAWPEDAEARPEFAAFQEVMRLLRAGVVDEGRGEVLALGPLSVAAVRSAAEECLPGVAEEDRAARALAEKCGGNPMLLEEVLRALFEAGRVVAREGRWRLDRPEEALAAVDAARLLADRLDAMDDETRTAARDASVIGPIFDARMLAEVSGRNEGEVFDLLDRAVDANLVGDAGVTADGRSLFRFRSASAHRAAYDTYEGGARRLAHRKVGEAERRRAGADTEAAAWRLAYHFERAEAREQARAYAEQAARAARRRFRAEEAAHYPRILAGMAEREAPLDERSQAAALDFLREFRAVVARVQMYPPGHQAVAGSVANLMDRGRRAFQPGTLVSARHFEGALLINGARIEEREFNRAGGPGIVQLLERKGLRAVSFRPGVAEEDLAALFEIMAHGAESAAEALRRRGVTAITVEEITEVDGAAKSGGGTLAGALAEAGIAADAEDEDAAPAAPLPDFAPEAPAFGEGAGPEAFAEDVHDLSPDARPEFIERVAAGMESEALRARVFADIGRLGAAERAALRGRLSPNAARWMDGEDAGAGDADAEADGVRNAAAEGRGPPSRAVEDFESEGWGEPDAEAGPTEREREAIAETLGAIAAPAAAREANFETLEDALRAAVLDGRREAARTALRALALAAAADDARAAAAGEVLVRALGGMTAPEHAPLFAETVMMLAPEGDGAMPEAAHGLWGLLVETARYELVAALWSAARARGDAAFLERAEREIRRLGLHEAILADLLSGDAARAAGARPLVKALGRALAEPLIEHLAEASDARARLQAASALGALAAEARPRLASELASQRDPNRLGRLLEAAPRVGGSEVARAVESLARGRTPSVRRAAVKALGQMTGPAAEGAFLALLGAQEEELRLDAVRAAGALGLIGAAPALLRLFEEDGDASDDLLREAALALGRMKARDAEDAMVRAFGDRGASLFRKGRSPEVRAAALLSLAAMGAASLDGCLAEASRDRAEAVRDAAAALRGRRAA